MNPASMRRRFAAVAILSLGPLLLSGALWVAQDDRGYLAVALSLAALAFVAYLALRGLPAVLARAAKSVEGARRELAQARREVRTAVHAVNEAADGLARGNRNLSERTKGQASAIEQAAASVEELVASVNGNTDTARETQRVVNLAGEATGKGVVAATMVIARMESIREETAKVAEIVGLIDAIAFQTNILALNAAVEAARAGDQGRGFAVVAAEVRNLAQRSATAATEIKELIAASVAKVESGGRQVDEAGGSIDLLVEGVQRVSDLMSRIASANLEQQRGIEQVSASVTQMDGVLQQNAVAVQRSAVASDKLKRDAGELAQTVSRFRLAEDAPPSEPASDRAQLVVARLSTRG